MSNREHPAGLGKRQEGLRAAQTDGKTPKGTADSGCMARPWAGDSVEELRTGSVMAGGMVWLIVFLHCQKRKRGGL